jgi:hypothetical protein
LLNGWRPDPVAVPLEARGILGGSNQGTTKSFRHTRRSTELEWLGSGDGACRRTSDQTHADVRAEYYFNLSMLDAAVVKARTMAPLRSARSKLNGLECYVAILHPYQVLDLRRNTSTGQWLDIQKAAMMGGQIANNPIFTGAVGLYNGVIMHEDARVPYSGNASDQPDLPGNPWRRAPTPQGLTSLAVCSSARRLVASRSAVTTVTPGRTSSTSGRRSSMTTRTSSVFQRCPRLRPEEVGVQQPRTSPRSLFRALQLAKPEPTSFRRKET